MQKQLKRFVNQTKSTMYYHIQDFLNDRKAEEGNTVKIFNLITEEAKGQKINPNVRTLERLAWHIAETLPEMGSAAGLFDAGLASHGPTPPTMQDIISVYLQNSAKLMEAVQAKWKDADLGDELPMYGRSWNKGLVLTVINGHEAHHRSQMTVVMRMLGLPVTGIYGPAKEEWALMGMPAME
jgi:uncharacterized damage-inducible protein DinB